MRNAQHVVDLERRLGGLLELDLQRPLLRLGNAAVLHVANWTYWLAQFAVVLLVVVWVYLRRHHAYARLRNAIIVANTIGLAGYILFPLAPPRLLPGYGFVDTLAQMEPLNHGTGLVELFSNPYAAMPSLHTADALILGIAVATLARRWPLRIAALAWPVWVALSLLATANHFWVDVAAGALLGTVAWYLTRACVGKPLERRARRRMIDARLA
jgi:membrane-associated phospholipid phosphatase